MDQTLRPKPELRLKQLDILDPNTPNLYEIISSCVGNTGFFKIKFDYKNRVLAITQALHHLNFTQETLGLPTPYFLSFQLDPVCFDPS